MRARFFIILLILLTALVIQVKWGNWFALAGAPLVVGSLALAGTFLDWDETLFITLLAVWAMNSQRGGSVEVFLLLAVSCVAWSVSRLTLPSVSRAFVHMRKDIGAPVISACAVVSLLYISAFSVASTPPLGAIVASGMIAVFWSVLGVYVFEFLR